MSSISYRTDAVTAIYRSIIFYIEFVIFRNFVLKIIFFWLFLLSCPRTSVTRTLNRTVKGYSKIQRRQLRLRFHHSWAHFNKLSLVLKTKEFYRLKARSLEKLTRAPQGGVLYARLDTFHTGGSWSDKSGLVIYLRHRLTTGNVGCSLKK